jgi:hypothetical protein
MSANSKFKLDALAASYLDQDVAEAKAQLGEIDREIEKLQAKRRAIEWKIERLGAPAGPAREASSFQVAVASNGSNGGEKPVHNGFRDTIRKVLREAGRGLKTKEIAELILKSGFQYTAKTSLSVRVGSDLRRLVHSGVVSQRRGLYSINQESQTMESTQ